MTTEDARGQIDRALETLAGQLDAGLSDAMRSFLATMARFHHYSFSNKVLIHVQRPEATRVAGFTTWKGLGRFVKKGEKGIAILAPCGRRTVTDQKEDGDQDEAPAAVRSFRVVHVFDVAQTDGEELPAPSQVTGDPGGAIRNLEAFARGKGIRIEYREDLGRALGQSSGGMIEILAGMPAAQTFSTLVHELAHELLHWSASDEVRADKTLVETQAEAVAFVVSTAIGLETNTAAADYIQLYRGDRAILKASLAAIQSAAGQILAAVLPEK